MFAKCPTKLLANRLGLIIHKVISDTQTIFIKYRFIMEGIVILHKPYMRYITRSSLECFSKLILKNPMTNL
jgi:short subunit fatty acids transporter